MSLPLLIAIVVTQGQATQGQTTTPPPVTQAITQQTAASQPFSSAFNIAEPRRMALTPKIDGKLDDEEWDPLSSTADMKSFFQWEPGKFFIAAIVPVGHDVIASFDLKSNGWLIGKDNLEVRLSNSQGKVQITARVMDGTGIAGPKWIDVPGLGISSYGSCTSDGTNNTYEACILDSGLGLIPTNAGSKMMMRIDDPQNTDAPAPAYLPRSLSPVTLVFERSAALPPGLTFKPEGAGRCAIPGEGTRIRLGFNGNGGMKIQSLEMHSEGFAKNDTNANRVPFPPFDKRGRSYVDYSTDIAAGSPEGYRVLKGTLTTSDGISSILECSYRVGSIVDFEIPQQMIPTSTTDRSVKLAFYVRSNSSRRVTGKLTLSAPDPLRILNGVDHSVGIYTNRGSDRQTFELFVPPNTAGTFPIKFSAILNGKKVEHIEYVTVGGL